MLDTNLLILLISAMVIIGGVSAYITYLKISKQKSSGDDKATAGMQLQSYERLILLTDRIALSNLISRLNLPDASAREMQQILTNNIKEEFNYNISQQVYVSADAWTAVKTLKDQNMLIINQFSNALPPEATALDLNKLLLEYAMNDKKGAVHEMVSEVLSYEAKKVMV